ncbi:peptidase M6 [Pseudoalteromonas piscicida]|uniref:Peptidase M6 n=1 Tax=Pseudoalteromonas piscicida TaxID=43662 RepID=A0AAQ2ESY3_PSEO7|nr:MULTISPECIES: immune inhibitor A domain-containing protein [Pseudoalteromonas]TMN35875.1 peptidase M6 [Pseudoalteromonas piscicida]TMN40868.1 peptidase M6 [Pseudoalteromonas piscicida]TMN50534.1 peptidase M6 [Pseudoalteromonas piscicida]TMN58186.1 peptidase M6 [Pseudoalteromonas piscicida]TMN59553.1 peptidase M6 [Pseudoalteromonas piscicida]
MNTLKLSILASTILLSSAASAQVLYKDQVIYWQEKKLGRTLSEYERKIALEQFVKTTPIASQIKTPYAIKNVHLGNTKLGKQFAVGTAQTLNEAKILAILVDFPDLPNDQNRLNPGDTDMYYPSYPASHYQSLLYSDSGYNGPNNESLQSATQFYQAASGGSFKVSGNAFGWVRAAQNAAYYGEQEGDTRDLRPEELVFEAVSKAVTQFNIDLSEYDKTDLNDIDGDGNRLEPDGIIDHVMLFHSSIGQEAGGGVLDTDAIWSHRFFVFDENNQPKAIPDTNYKVYNYTINPIDAAIGVVVHEFGHDLGLPDEYDLNSNDIGEPVALWSVMSSGSYLGQLSGSQPTQFSPKSLEFLQQNYAGNWLNQTEYTFDDLSTEQTVTLTDIGVNNGTTNQIKINLPAQLEEFITPLDGNYHYYSGQDDKLNNQASFTVSLPNASQISLSMLANYSIELNYDIFQVAVNGQPIAGNTTKSNHPNYASVTNYMDGESSAFGANPITLDFDISAYRGQTVTVTFVYQTDDFETLKGVLLDNIAVTADGSQIYTNTAEPTNDLVYNGFRKISGYRAKPSNAYYAHLRSFRGLDAGLSLSGYNTGVLMWYSNYGQSNNSTSLHPGSGNMLVIDQDQNPIFKADGTTPATSIIQIKDATLRLDTQKAGLGDQHLTPISTFDDTQDYTFSIQKESGVSLPGFGVQLRLNTIEEDASSAQVGVIYLSDPKITQVQSQNTVKFNVKGLALNESDSFLWNFGDGQTSNALSPVHSYQDIGNYTVMFTRTKADGSSSALSSNVSVGNVEPIPLTVGDIKATAVGQGFVFNAEIIGGKAPYELEWNFGDGTTATSNSVEHIYELSGTYTVTLNVKDTEGEAVTKSTSVTVVVPLNIEASATTSNLQASFVATAAGGDGNYQASWDFGDGTQGSGLTTTHSYAQAGTYNVVLTLSDGADQSAKGTVEITVTAPTTTPTDSGDSGSSGGSIGWFALIGGVLVGLRRRWC